jgi:predicted small lipoprotein YifL
MKALIAIAALAALTACNEIPQDATKPYAGKEDTKAYAGDRFKGDKQKYEQALAERSNFQNEYLRTGDAKK